MGKHDIEAGCRTLTENGIIMAVVTEVATPDEAQQVAEDCAKKGVKVSIRKKGKGFLVLSPIGEEQRTPPRME